LERPTGICLAVKLGREKSLTRCLDNVQEEIRFPTLVPARQSVMFVIATPKIYTKRFDWANSGARKTTQGIGELRQKRNAKFGRLCAV
jgi:hypothetical protein